MSKTWHFLSAFEAGVAGGLVYSGFYGLAVVLGLFSILSAVTSVGVMIKETLEARQ